MGEKLHGEESLMNDQNNEVVNEASIAVPQDVPFADEASLMVRRPQMMSFVCIAFERWGKLKR